MINLLKTLTLLAVGTAILAGCALALLYAYPAPLFEHRLTQRHITLYSDCPIPDSAYEIVDDVITRLEASPLQADPDPMDLYIVCEDWRRALIWRPVAPEMAGGFVVVPFSRRHAFLSSADYDRGLMVLPGSVTIQAPRTLAYFGAHELTHVETAALVGPVRFHLMPNWVREGIADYVGMASDDSFADLYAVIGDQRRNGPLAQTHGWYAPYRMLVTYYLDVKGWSIDELFATNLSEDDARAEVLAYGEKISR